MLNINKCYKTVKYYKRIEKHVIILNKFLFKLLLGNKNILSFI